MKNTYKYAREYYQKNREKLREYSRKYHKEHYQENREKIIEQTRDYYQQHKNDEDFIQKRKNYRVEHKEDIRELQRKWMKDSKKKYITGYRNYVDEHTKETRKKARNYSEENPDKRVEYQRRYREKNKAYLKMVQETSQMIKDGDIEKKPCNVCREKEVMAYHLDRINPFNIVFLCKEHFWDRKKQEYRKKKDNR